MNLQGVEARFWPRVQRTETCWIWMGARTPLNYGTINIGGRAGRNHYAHRVSWEIANGSILEGLCVLHRCDNPPCVNPAHLFLGTKKDNTRDMIVKGRGRQPVLSGEKHPSAKLTGTMVQEIRSLHAAGHASQAALAFRFGVSQAHVSKILCGANWAEQLRRQP